MDQVDAGWLGVVAAACTLLGSIWGTYTNDDAKLVREMRKASKNTIRAMMLEVEYRTSSECRYRIFGREKVLLDTPGSAAAYLKHERKSAELRNTRAERL